VWSHSHRSLVNLVISTGSLVMAFFSRSSGWQVWRDETTSSRLKVMIWIPGGGEYVSTSQNWTTVWTNAFFLVVWSAFDTSNSRKTFGLKSYIFWNQPLRDPFGHSFVVRKHISALLQICFSNNYENIAVWENNPQDPKLPTHSHPKPIRTWWIHIQNSPNDLRNESQANMLRTA
jgi:hypothetical protein